MELPLAVKRLDQARVGSVLRGCRVPVRRVMGARRLFADAEDARILPVRNAGRGGLRGDAERQNKNHGEKKTSRAPHAITMYTDIFRNAIGYMFLNGMGHCLK